MKLEFRRLRLALAGVLMLSAAMTAFTARAADDAPADAPVTELTAADMAVVQRAQDWLQSVQTLRARFVQVGANGGQATGGMKLKRPGLIRFDYDPPAKVLLVSDGTLVSFVDYEVGQVSQWPLFDTPLSYLVRKRLDLAGEAVIDEVRSGPASDRFRLRDPDNLEQGSITLEFGGEPYGLLGWRVRDAQGQDTVVALARVETNVEFPVGAFLFEAPQNQFGVGVDR